MIESRSRPLQAGGGEKGAGAASFRAKDNTGCAKRQAPSAEHRAVLRGEPVQLRLFAEGARP